MTEYTGNFRLPIPDFRSVPWHAQLEETIRKIDSALYDYLVVSEIAAWTNLTDYAISDYALDTVTGKFWVAKVAHTSAASPTTFAQDRAANPTYWQEVLKLPVSRGIWTTATQYVEGDFVVDSGRYAVCLIPHTSGLTFDADLALGRWEVLVDGDTITSLLFSVGRQGATNPALKVDSSLASTVTGVEIVARAVAGGVDIRAISSGANEDIRVAARGTGKVVLNGEIDIDSSSISPSVDGGSTIGKSTSGFGGMYLQSGATVNWGAGGVTGFLTHVAGTGAVSDPRARFGINNTTPDSQLHLEEASSDSNNDTRFVVSNTHAGRRAGVLVAAGVKHIDLVMGQVGVGVLADRYGIGLSPGGDYSIIGEISGANHANVGVKVNSTNVIAPLCVGETETMTVGQSSGTVIAAFRAGNCFVSARNTTADQEARFGPTAGGAQIGLSTTGQLDFLITSAANLILDTTHLMPGSDGGKTLGRAADLRYAGLNLTNGADINWNNGGITIDGTGSTVTLTGILAIVSTGNAQTITASGAASQALTVLASNAGYASANVARLQTNVSAGTGFNFLLCTSDVDGTPDNEFIVRGDGAVFSDNGTAMSTPAADIGEMKEWEDGNPDEEDRAGYSVVYADKGKIRKATADDDPFKIFGVVSYTTGILGNSPYSRWPGKYLKDPWGRDIWEELDPDEEGFVRKRRKLNPKWDKKQAYVPRTERREWAPIGLTGEVRVRKGQPTHPNWIMIKKLSKNIELWHVR